MPTIVSIHAPTRGATQEAFRRVEQISVSIHAPTRGATFVAHEMPAGEDVSIHAPTRGATFLLVPCGMNGRGFNPRTHTGCDETNGMAFMITLMFQSTHPHGVRLTVKVVVNTFAPVSIHAPTRGATQ